MPRLLLLTALVLLLPVLGCNGRPDETDDVDSDVEVTEPEKPAADSVSQWVHAGVATAVTNEKACLYLTAQAVNPGLLGDSVQVAIAPAPAETDTLPPLEERLPRPDVVVATSPQFFCGWAGVLVSRLRRAPFVLEIRDIWPESIEAVATLHEMGIRVAMITGDARSVAESVAGRIGIDDVATFDRPGGAND